MGGSNNPCISQKRIKLPVIHLKHTYQTILTEIWGREIICIFSSTDLKNGPFDDLHLNEKQLGTPFIHSVKLSVCCVISFSHSMVSDMQGPKSYGTYTLEERWTNRWVNVTVCGVLWKRQTVGLCMSGVGVGCWGHMSGFQLLRPILSH